jgi:hypothetical protein
MTSPIWEAMRNIGFVPIDDLRAHVAAMDSTESTCRWCHQPIRSTPSVHTDGSIHWASGGWEHTNTEQGSCGPDHPYRWAEPKERAHDTNQ